jgi:hypothetical protein
MAIAMFAQDLTPRSREVQGTISKSKLYIFVDAFLPLNVPEVYKVWMFWRRTILTVVNGEISVRNTVIQMEKMMFDQS